MSAIRFSKSEYTGILDEVQREATNILKPLGFRRSGRTYNRKLDRGLVQVINFQMGAYPIGPRKESRFRLFERLFGFGTLYGHFTINLGLYIPEVSAMRPLIKEYFSKVKGDFIPFHACTLQVWQGRLGADKIQWWSIKENGRDAKLIVSEYLQQRALPFCVQFDSREKLLLEWEKRGVFPGSNELSSALDAATILHYMGRKAKAAAVLSKLYSSYLASKDERRELALQSIKTRAKSFNISLGGENKYKK